MASFQEIARKKVLGVPVIYLAGGFVVILGIVAWKLKPATDTADPTDTTTDPTTGLAPTANPYDSLNPDGDGTVTVQQLGPNVDTTDAVVKTNTDWVNEGSVWLNKNKDVAGSAALAALNKYINGEDRSFAEQQWIDAWFAQDGPPPDGVAEGGNAGAKPTPAPQRQFTAFPGVHVIRGGSDNGYTALAKLYYNSTAADRIDLLQAANTKLGASGPWSIGTKVIIPAYHAPVFYSVPSTLTYRQVASKNGISVDQLSVLNNGHKTTYHKGDRVRVK